jgi:hypothetical protein
VSRPAPTPPGGGGSNRLLWGAVAIVLLLAGGLVLLAGMRDDAGDTATADTAAPAETTSTDAPATIEDAAPTTEATTTEGRTSTSTEPPTTTEREASARAAGDPGDAALAYLAALDADELDRAWAMTTPRFQARQDRDQWERFWAGHDVDVVGDPRVDDGTVVVPLTYDGQREDYRLDMVSQGGGWLVDGPVGA